MTIADLIEQLNEYPLDMEVTIKGYEGGVSSDVRISVIHIKRDYYSEWYYGEHERVDLEEADSTVLNFS